jgi:hypothetical protein
LGKKTRFYGQIFFRFAKKNSGQFKNPPSLEFKKLSAQGPFFWGEVKRLAKVIKAVLKKPVPLGLKTLGFMGQFFFGFAKKKFRPV